MKSFEKMNLKELRQLYDKVNIKNKPKKIKLVGGAISLEDKVQIIKSFALRYNIQYFNVIDGEPEQDENIHNVSIIGLDFLLHTNQSQSIDNIYDWISQSGYHVYTVDSD